MSIYRILFVCHGNICRSPMAECIMTHLVREAGLADTFRIASKATSTEELGNPLYPPARRTLREMGVPVLPHRAAQIVRGDYGAYEYLVGMDSENIRAMERIFGGDPDGKIHRLLAFTTRGGDIADPWYTGDFDTAYQQILEGCRGLLAHVAGA